MILANRFPIFILHGRLKKNNEQAQGAVFCLPSCYKRKKDGQTPVVFHQRGVREDEIKR